MILVDTNIIIDFWNNNNSLEKVFEDEEIAICGVVQAELLHGAKDQNEKQSSSFNKGQAFFFDEVEETFMRWSQKISCKLRRTVIK